MSEQNSRFLSSSENANFSKRKSKISNHGTRCLGPYNFFVSQRRKLILWENEIQIYCYNLNKKNFWNPFVSISKNRSEDRQRPDSMASFRREIAPADAITLRCNHSTNHMGWSVGAPQGMEIKPANEFHEFKNLNPSAASIFSKIWSFQNFRLMDQVACARITFLFRNAWPWYLQETFLRHGPTERSTKLFRIHPIWSRKITSKFENPWIVRPPFVEQLSL